MRILELLGEKIAKSSIFEMAFDRKDVEAKITSLSEPITEHLIKVLKWEDDTDKHKHLRDIDGWLYKVQRLKLRKNRKPTSHEYFEWLFTDVVQDEITLNRWIKGMHQYSTLPVSREDQEVFDIIKAIYYKVSFDLETNSFDTITNYYNFESKE
jgi:hypothetical protein